ncbi:Ada metal-binding domain-containing protein, partial [Pseudomonas aeruginosa]|uniref:Ada metal-binding domain-containing protein n=1 Tax=Pseudomonas aeruginosa TaxID=287 RepID=UPI0027E3C15A
MSQQLDPCNAYHTDEQRWAAVLARDAAADGAFVYAVKTTGVYCRPSSSARRPRRENVEFFATAEAAEAAGGPPLAVGPDGPPRQAREPVPPEP